MIAFGRIFPPTIPSTMQRFRVAFMAAVIMTIGATAWASSGGITTKSGKQTGSCNGCHNGGRIPSVKLEGPTALEAGTLATYTFRVESDSGVVVGMNAAIGVDDAVMFGQGDGGFTRVDSNEVTHIVANRFDAGAFTYTFSVQAPPFGGKVTLYAAGNACNNNGQTDGDESARTTLDIQVSGPERPPPPEAGPPPPPRPTTVPTPDASTTRPSEDAGDGDNAVAPEEDSGCSIGWSDQSSSIPAGAALAGVIGIAAIMRKKKKR